MFKLRVAVFALFLAALSTAPAMARDRDDDRDHDDVKKVKVVNAPNVNVVNTPLVNVGTLPAVQLAPGSTVGISGTPSVQITNTPANPLVVQDAGAVNQTPFQTEVTVEVKAGNSIGSGFVAVPAGKRLVIEFASVAAVAPTGDSMLFQIVTQSNNGTQPPVSTRHCLPTLLTTPSTAVQSDENQYEGGLLVKLFSDPGTQVELRASRGALNSGNAIAIFSLSGYFEDAK